MVQVGVINHQIQQELCKEKSAQPKKSTESSMIEYTGSGIEIMSMEK